MRPTGIPSLRVAGGEASPLPQLALTGIAGVIGPPPAGVSGAAGGLVIDLRGSYGGAHEALWTAKGHADPAHGTGKLSLRAEQFSLGRIADVLPKSVLAPENTTLDAALDLDWLGDAVKFGGELAVVGLSLQSDALAADPVQNVSLGITMRGTVYPVARRLELERAEARVRDVTARVAGHIALPSGTFRFTNGKSLSVVPDIDLHFSVPRVACSKLLSSIPSALVPRLQGFVLQGFFAADVGAKIDFAHLDDLDLTGKVGIDGCKVVKAPDDVKALAEPETLVINVDVPKLPGSPPGETDTVPVVVGPDNPDFAPYDQISPYLVGSIMTTEDNGFFKHHGWVSSEFKSALRRNLQGGGFRLGASSITMQMTKNVLLTKDKTLSRKLQELFLVWYLEQELPKERILELYFNAIEFGPRIYGIGAADPALLRQEAGRSQSAGGGVLLVDPAVAEAPLRPVLPRRAVAAVGSLHPADPGQGARARADHRRRVRRVFGAAVGVRPERGQLHREAVPRVGQEHGAAQDRARDAPRSRRG